MLNYQPSSIKYNNEVKIRAFRKDNADYVTTRSLGETIMLQTGAMNANTLKIFNFSRYETPIKINSIYVSSSDADKTQINFIVKIESQIIFDFTLASQVIPYAFPYLVLFPFNTVTVKPKFNITDCYIYAEPNYVLDVYSL
jgi:hypothetical protein